MLFKVSLLDKIITETLDFDYLQKGKKALIGREELCSRISWTTEDKKKYTACVLRSTGRKNKKKITTCVIRSTGRKTLIKKLIFMSTSIFKNLTNGHSFVLFIVLQT